MTGTRAKPRVFSSMKGIGAASMLAALAGCAPIYGNQRPVTAAQINDSYVCPTRAQLIDRPTNEEPGPYRDRVVLECIKAINGQYLKFREDLHSAAVGTNLATDIVSLGLTTGASIASGATAKRLAAGGAFVLGTGTAINKDIFYQQTLPAIEAVMDANRDVALTRIIEAEKKDPEAKSYKLTNAGIDLDALQAAGDIYTAINALNHSAAKEAETAKAALAEAQAKPADAGLVVPLDTSVAPRLYAVVAKVKKLDGTAPADLAKLKAIAAALNVAVADGEAVDLIKRDVVVAIDRALEVPGVDAQQAAITRIEGLVK